MEFLDITVGSGYLTPQVKATPSVYGTFDSTINRIEIVLLNSGAEKASGARKSDLRWGADPLLGPRSRYPVEVQLTGARKYVRLTYRLSPSIIDATTQIHEDPAE